MEIIIIIALSILIISWYIIGFIICYTPKLKRQEVQSISNKEYEEFLKSNTWKKIQVLELIQFDDD